MVVHQLAWPKRRPTGNTVSRALAPKAVRAAASDGRRRARGGLVADRSAQSMAQQVAAARSDRFGPVSVYACSRSPPLAEGERRDLGNVAQIHERHRRDRRGRGGGRPRRCHEGRHTGFCAKNPGRSSVCSRPRARRWVSTAGAARGNCCPPPATTGTPRGRALLAHASMNGTRCAWCRRLPRPQQEHAGSRVLLRRRSGISKSSRTVCTASRSESARRRIASAARTVTLRSSSARTTSGPHCRSHP